MRRYLALFLLALTAGSAPTSAQDEMIFATCYLGEHTYLCTADPAEAGSHAATYGPLDASISLLSISENGLLMAYQSNGDPENLYLANGDGSSARVVYESGRVRTVALSPDGSKIAYSTDAGTESVLYVVDLETGERTKVLEYVPDWFWISAGWPVWSPDGTRLLYNVQDHESRTNAIYVVDADSSGTSRQVTFPTNTADAMDDVAADWSPEGGGRIAFLRQTRSSVPGGGHVTTHRIYTVDIDVGTTPHLVYESDGTMQGGAVTRGVQWSPDASKLAFVWVGGAFPQQYVLYTVRATGSDLTEINATTFGMGHWYERAVQWASLGERDIVVNDDRDLADLDPEDGICDASEEPGEQCTLRAAIEEANARGSAEISFNIPGEGVPTIRITEYEDEPGPFQLGLPPIEALVTLDGTTQPGGWVEIVGTGVDGVHWNGSAAGTRADAIRIGPGGAGSTIRGLVINRFLGSAIRLMPGANGCTIEGNRLGTDVSGTERRGTPAGFHIDYTAGCIPGYERPCGFSNYPLSAGLRVGSHYNVIQHNIIAGNARVWDTDGPLFFGGINLLLDRFTRQNTIRGNRIGIGADGLVVVNIPDLYDQGYTGGQGFNQHVGILLQGYDNVVGGPVGDGNLIAGHTIDVLSLAPSPHSLLANAFGHVPIESLVPDHVALLLLGPRSPLFDETAPVGRTRIEGNNVRSPHQAAVVGGSYDLIANALHGRIGGWSEPPPGASSSFHVDAAIHMGDDVRLIGNEIRSPGWAVLVVGENAVSEQNDITGVWGGIRVPELDDMTSSVLISRNSIVSRNMGIDLGGVYAASVNPDGVTPNDVTDLDTGPNTLLNFPVPLQVSRQNGVIAVEGVLWGAYSGSYTVEVFGNTHCSEANYAGRYYGAGEHYLGAVTVTPGALDFGEPAFSFIEGGLEERYRYVTLTSSRVDLGVTSEFSMCLFIPDVAQTARADVSPDQTGEVLAAQDAAVEIARPAAARQPGSRSAGAGVAAGEGGGTLYLTRYETAPDTSTFADSTATAPGGTPVRPEAVANAYWWLADRHLTVEGGNDGADLWFTVCFRPEGRVLDGWRDRVVLVQRNLSTEGLWEPRDTERVTRGGATYLCASGLSALGEFSFGGNAAAFEGGEPGGEVPERFALSAAYPNPFNPAATLRLDMPEAGHARVAVYDALGRRVAVLLDGRVEAGTHPLRFDAGGLASGVYLVRATTDHGTQTRRVTLLR